MPSRMMRAEGNNNDRRTPVRSRRKRDATPSESDSDGVAHDTESFVVDDEAAEHEESSDEGDNTLTPPPLSQKRKRTHVMYSDDDGGVPDNVESPQKPSRKARDNTAKHTRVNSRAKRVSDSEDEKTYETDSKRSRNKSGGSRVGRRVSGNKKGSKRESPRRKKRACNDSDLDEDGSRLVDGDTMYRGSGSKRVVTGHLNESGIVTPPLQTRSTSTANQVPVDASAANKGKPSDTPVTNLEKVQEYSSKPVNVPESSGSRNIAANVDSNATVERSEAVNSELKSGEMGVQGKDADKGKQKEVYYEDIFTTPPTVWQQTLKSPLWLPRPYTKAKCEVDDPALYDNDLLLTGAYDNLPKLRFCDVINGNSNIFTAGQDDIVTAGWDLWRDLLPNNVDVVQGLLTFVRDGRYVNLSRIEPSLLAARAMASSRHELVIDNATAVCVSLATIRRSCIFKDIGNQYMSHGFMASLLTHEFQRFCGMIGEFPHRSTIGTSIWESGLQFATKNNTSSKTEDDKRAKAATSRFYRAYQSPHKKASSSGTKLRDHIPGLEYTDDIPVYDGRNLPVGFEWSAQVFSNLPGYFNRMQKDELPEESFVALGYVLQYYIVPLKDKSATKAEDDLRFGCMLRWAIYFGTPDC